MIWQDERVYDQSLLTCEVKVLSCPAGFWGYNITNTSDCSQTCEGCSDDEPCGVEDGHCYGGCKAGLWGPNCDQSCYCASGGSCRMSDGYCEGGCRNGSWGISCDQSCDCEVGQSCDQNNGSCPLRESKSHNSLPPKINNLVICGSGGWEDSGDAALGPIYFIFMQFSEMELANEYCLGSATDSGSIINMNSKNLFKENFPRCIMAYLLIANTHFIINSSSIKKTNPVRGQSHSNITNDSWSGQ